MQTLKAVEELDGILVDTDSPVIMQGLAEHFPDIRVIERPKHLLGDAVPMNEILIHDTGLVDSTYYLQTHSTNPLLRSETISNAINTFLRAVPEYDSMFGVTRLQTRLWDQLGRPVNHNPKVLLRTQDLPPIYEENSCLYIFTREILMARRNRLGERPMMFEVPPVEAWDIDEELDFTVADTLFRELNGESTSQQ